MGDKFVAQLRPGRQTCRPAANFCVTKKQKQLSAIFLLFGHTEIHSWATNLSPSSDQGDKLVGLVTSGYV
jgi:hypothetical protein